MEPGGRLIKRTYECDFQRCPLVKYKTSINIWLDLATPIIRPKKREVHASTQWSNNKSSARVNLELTYQINYLDRLQWAVVNGIISWSKNTHTTISIRNRHHLHAFGANVTLEWIPGVWNVFKHIFVSVWPAYQMFWLSLKNSSSFSTEPKHKKKQIYRVVSLIGSHSHKSS